MLGSNSKLPKVEQIKKKVGQINFSLMVNLPLILKEKEIYERKNTIQVFKKKRNQVEQVSMFRKKYDYYSNPGKIYINEFWSDKYKKLILKDSNIDYQDKKIQQLARKNLSELVEDVHTALIDGIGTYSKDLQTSKQMSQAYLNSLSIIKKNSRDDEESKYIDTDRNREESIQRGYLIRAKIRNKQKSDCFQTIESSIDKKDRDISSILQPSNISSLSSVIREAQKYQFKQRVDDLLNQCEIAQNPVINLLEKKEKPWKNARFKLKRSI